MVKWVNASSAALLLTLTLTAGAAAPPVDPLGSVMWDYHRQIFIGDAPYEFDPRVKVQVPDYAEDATQVPVAVDARALAGEVEKIVAWAELNPIQHIFTYYPSANLMPALSLRIKVQQATPVRAAVLTRDGRWHVGSARIDAEGGGCTAPRVAATDSWWEDHLGDISSRTFFSQQQSRYKLKVVHPMDTGLVGNIPEFFIEQLELRNGDGEVVARMELSAPVSSNPVFTFDLAGQGEGHHLWLRDNNGNEFEQSLQGAL